MALTNTRGLLLLAGASFAVTAALLAAGTRQFARPFVRFDGGEVETPTVGDATGGFERAGGD